MRRRQKGPGPGRASPPFRGRTHPLAGPEDKVSPSWGPVSPERLGWEQKTPSKVLPVGFSLLSSPPHPPSQFGAFIVLCGGRSEGG